LRISAEHGVFEPVAAPLFRNRAFLALWSSAFISASGSALTEFVLAVWIYQMTGSVLAFATGVMLRLLPLLLMAPVGGAAADRWPRRRVLIVTNLVGAVASGVLSLVFAFGTPELWHVYTVIVVSSITRAFQFPAFSALVTSLVNPQDYGRSQGLIEAAHSGAAILAYALAGAAFARWGAGRVIAFDMLSFLVPVATLAVMSVVEEASEVGSPKDVRSVFAHGWTFIAAHQPLRRLLLFFAVMNALFAVASVLFQPLVLQRGSPASFGHVMALGALGTVLGGSSMAVWGGPVRRFDGVLLGWLGVAVGVIIAGTTGSLMLIACGFFLMTFANAVLVSCNQSIWAAHTPSGLRGRVLSARIVVAWSAMPIAYMVSGALAERVFEPLMQSEGRLATAFAWLIGAAPPRGGHGTVLLFTLTGLVLLIAIVISWRIPRLRNLEADLTAPPPANANAHPMSLPPNNVTSVG
jgi:DHA3 family macrolide efflux protein-like MFS transporter